MIRMSGPHRSTTGKLVAIVAAGALAMSACSSSKSGSSANTPGVTATSITIGSHQPLTGPAAPSYSEIAPGAKAMFSYINDNGGIYGRKINYIYKDDGYDPTKTVTVVKSLVLQDKVFAIFNGLGTPTHSQVTDYLNSEKVPDLFVASGAQLWDQPKKHPYTFGWQTDYIIEGKILGQYIKQKYAGKKIGYMLQNDDFGSDGAKGLDMYIKSSVVDRETYTPGKVDISAQITNLKAKGAQVVVCFCIPAYTALTILTGAKLGFGPQLVVSNVGSDPTTLAGLLEAFAKQGGATVKGSELINGIVTDAYATPVSETSNSWIQLFKKVHDKYIPKLPLDGNVFYGMAAAYTFAEALVKAGKNLTRSGIVKAVAGGLPAGPGLVPFRFSADSHAGYSGTQIGTIHNGGIVVTGTPEVTDDGSGPITPYTTAQSPAPANGIPPQ